ncbi:hypothetical protein BDV12DRAFT_107168 [Aspergillus spectabilis]
MKKDLETSLLQGLQWCTKLLAQYPHLRSNTKVSTAINSLYEGSPRPRMSRKRKRQDPLYQPSKPFKRREAFPISSNARREISRHAISGTDSSCSSASHEASDPRTTTTQAHQSKDTTNATLQEVSQEAPHNSCDAATNTTPQEDSHRTLHGAASTHASQDNSRENPAHISHASRELSPDATSDASRETSCDPDTGPISCDHPMTIPLAVKLVHHYSQQLYEPPQRLYTEVVRSIQADIEIKDGIMRDVLKTILWKDLIETPFARQQKLVIFNLLEHMGVSEWFERQVCLAQETFHTARHRPYKPRAAATKVLDNILGDRKDQKDQRQRIHKVNSRGKVLRYSLVKHLKLGILFSPLICEDLL